MTSKSWRCIIIVTLITFTYVICDQCDTWNSQISTEATYHCYDQNITKHECESKSSKITIHEPNEDGSINFEFDYTPYCEYKLDLLIWSNVKDEISCNMFRLPSEASVHSKYKFSGISDLSNDVNLQSCSETGNITIKYVYTGCYYFQFSYGKQLNLIKRFFTMPERKLNYKDFESESYFLLDRRPSDSQTFVNIKHPFIKQNPNIELEIKCIINCTIPYHELFSIVPSIDKFSAKGLMEYTLCNTNEDDSVEISCGVTMDVMKCVLDGLDSGLYEFQYSFNNLIRCPVCRNCLWINCSGRTNTSIKNNEISNIERSTSAPTKYTPVYWIFVGLVCIGGFVVIVLIVTYLNRGRPPPEKLPKYPKDEEFSGQSKVLLLYPRDVDIVMTTMEYLRKALIAEGFEVYDVYDEVQQKFIDENDYKWITSKLSDKFMKTVIVQTYCGQILVNSSYSADKLYKKPTCYDNIFPTAVSLIGQRVDPNSYTKLFIVNVGFDQVEYNEFKNPSTRYSLPHSYKELTRDLRDKKDCTIDLKNNNELEEFTCMCKKMKDIIEDPSYLSEILKVSILHLQSRPSINIGPDEKTNIVNSFSVRSCSISC